MPSPGAQHKACDPLVSRIRLQSRQRMGWQVKLAPNRNRVATMKHSESTVNRDRGSTVQSHFDETVSSRKSLRRAKSASLLGCASKCASRWSCPSWQKRTDKSCWSLMALIGVGASGSVSSGVASTLSSDRLLACGESREIDSAPDKMSVKRSVAVYVASSHIKTRSRPLSGSSLAMQSSRARMTLRS